VDERLSVAGVTLTEGGGNRVELLVTGEGVTVNRPGIC